MLRSLRPSFVGMHMAHIGLALIVMAITMVNTYEVERDLRLGPGESATAGGYAFTLGESRQVRGPNYTANEADIRVSRDGEPVAVLTPQRRNYDSRREMPMIQASLHRQPLRDIYVSLGDPLTAEVVRKDILPLLNRLEEET